MSRELERELDQLREAQAARKRRQRSDQIGAATSLQQLSAVGHTTAATVKVDVAALPRQDARKEKEVVRTVHQMLAAAFPEAERARWERAGPAQLAEAQGRRDARGSASTPPSSRGGQMDPPPWPPAS